MAFEVTEE